MSNRVITVKGIGRASAPPDWIKINMSLEAKDLSYEKTINLASKQMTQLRECLKEHGFDKKDIKTTNFNVDTSYKRVEDTDGNYDRVFNGYVCSQDLYIGFGLDNKKLGKILISLSHCKSAPEFYLRYQLKDEKKLIEELLKSAVTDATNKAKLLATAANVNLGEILSIDYNWTEVKFRRENFDLRELSCECAAASLDIEPDDIEASDTVSIIWEIK